MVTTDNRVKEINNYLIKTLSQERYKHSLSTAETVEKLCSMFGISTEKGFFTGLIHDIAREYDKEELINICRKSGEVINGYEIKHPVLLHGKAGAAVLSNKFNIRDKDILDAVRVHTTGKRDMTMLAKILFIADYIEPCRKHITDEYLESLDFSSIDGMLKQVLDSILEYYNSNGIEAAGPSLELLEELEV